MNEEQKKSAGIGCTGAVIFGMSNAAIIIGILNLSGFDFDSFKIDDPDSVGSKCFGAPRVPYYLIVMGVILIILVLLKFFFEKCCGKLKECGEDSKCCNTLNHMCEFTAGTAFDIAAVVIAAIWNAVGTNWTFGFWDTVSYDESAGQNYCPGYVYGFSCAMVIWVWISIIFVIMCGLLCNFCKCFFGLLCCKPCREADDNQAV